MLQQPNVGTVHDFSGCDSQTVYLAETVVDVQQIYLLLQLSRESL